MLLGLVRHTLAEASLATGDTECVEAREVPYGAFHMSVFVRHRLAVALAPELVGSVAVLDNLTLVLSPLEIGEEPLFADCPFRSVHKK